MVCAVNGVAGGVGLALACDLVLAAKSSRFIQLFVPGLALVPDFGVSWQLVRILGPARATALVMLGESLHAEEAERMGLIWRALNDSTLHSTASCVAARLAANSAIANRSAKTALHAAQHNDLASHLDLEARLQGRCASNVDFVEGMLAYQQKRKPRFNLASAGGRAEH